MDLNVDIRDDHLQGGSNDPSPLKQVQELWLGQLENYASTIKAAPPKKDYKVEPSGKDPQLPSPSPSLTGSQLGDPPTTGFLSFSALLAFLEALANKSTVALVMQGSGTARAQIEYGDTAANATYAGQMAEAGALRIQGNTDIASGITDIVMGAVQLLLVGLAPAEDPIDPVTDVSPETTNVLDDSSQLRANKFTQSDDDTDPVENDSNSEELSDFKDTGGKETAEPIQEQDTEPDETEEETQEKLDEKLREAKAKVKSNQTTTRAGNDDNDGSNWQTRGQRRLEKIGEGWQKFQRAQQEIVDKLPSRPKWLSDLSAKIPKSGYNALKGAANGIPMYVSQLDSSIGQNAQGMAGKLSAEATKAANLSIVGQNLAQSVFECTQSTISSTDQLSDSLLQARENLIQVNAQISEGYKV